ncbi:hypothetical protein [Companilactobacillus muriivasis]|uniref:hypothetical protein n=1 Tax=Companilactobacillus muriivasis TaxID=3081444 RepID=UPI0030C6A703
MATRLSNLERLIVNQLIDTGLFTSSPVKPTKEMTDAIMALKKTVVQNRVNNYLKDLIGITPENIQENLLLTLGSEDESAETVHVLLATLKAVINLPELQNGSGDRDVLTQTIVRQVRSEVVDLDEKEVQRLITKLFVERFKLFTEDRPDVAQSEQTQEITEYWNVSPDFNLVAQAIVNQLTNKQTPDLTDIQRVNRALLINRHISPKVSPYLWEVLLDNKDKIFEQWENLERFDLECGDDYALLLDRKLQKAKSKPAVVAISVAHSIHSGISEAEFNQLIKDSINKLFPTNDIGVGNVKESLSKLDLIKIKNDFVYPAPIVKRFAIEEKKVRE